MRQLVGGRAVRHGAASASVMGRFGTRMLTRPGNLAVLIDPPGRWDRRRARSATAEKRPLDMDSSESPVREPDAW